MKKYSTCVSQTGDDIIVSLMNYGIQAVHTQKHLLH